MARGRWADTAGQVAGLLGEGAIGGRTDGELLVEFRDGAAAGAERAFALLVERHGPMVLRACRAILRDEHDARDAFQATFLVLVRQARSIRRRDSIAAWLHEVARRTALSGRSATTRRRAHERRAAERAARVTDPPPRDDLGAVVHAELTRLSESHRAVVILCDLEGLTEGQAAGQLGWPLGTVRSRLARGRARLRARLARRGLAPGAAAWFAPPAPGRPTVPAALGGATTRAALVVGGRASTETVAANLLAITRDVHRSLLMSQLKVTVGAALVAGSVALGAVALARQDGAARPSPAPTPGDPPPARGKLTPLQLRHAEAEVMRQLRGTWQAVRSVQDGKEFRPDLEYERLAFDGEFRIEFRSRPREAVEGRRDERIGKSSVMVNPDKSPAEITFFGEGFLIQGIYELAGDDLKIAFFGRSEIDRPRGMAKDGNGLPLIVKTYRRFGP